MARGLARSGAKVMIASRRIETLEAACNKLSKETGGSKIHYTQLDLGDKQSTLQAAENAISELGGVDIFIGNAGKAAVKL